jgi:sugar lactone lactonase YvrE
VAYFPIGSNVVPVQPIGPTVRTEGNQVIIGGTGAYPGQLQNPSDVAFDTNGNIYVADTNNGRINKYDAQGVFVKAIGGFQSPDVQLQEPWSMVVAGDGTMFVADTFAHRIVKFDADFNQVDTWGVGAQTEAGGDPFGLFGPRDIALSPEGNVLITDTGNGRIIEYTAEGDFLRQFGQKGTSGAPLDFSEPVGILTDANGDIYIGDFWNRRVVVLDRDLNQKRTITVDPWGSQAVSDRGYMALLPDGRLLVTDPTNGKVLAYGTDGALIVEYQFPSEGSQNFTRPIGIATDGTSVLVADAAGSVVRKLPLSEIIR